jgi:MinD superfamily P-loop ATPase
VITEKIEAVIQIPQIHDEKCTACGKCVEVCQFHALAKVGKNILIFKQLCHGCGSCTLNCPVEAISETPDPIGTLEKGLTLEGIQFFQGLLTISEPMPTPVIRQLKKWVKPSTVDVDILDAPPGASCSVVETLRGVDYTILVTEPTPFGLHDLKQITGVIREMGIPAGIVINRNGIGDGKVEAFCAAENLPILLRIPFDRRIAEGIAEGKTLIGVYPEYSAILRQLVSRIQKDI